MIRIVHWVFGTLALAWALAGIIGWACVVLL